MKEKIAENERYLNQQAKRAMEEVGESPNPAHLYSLQLALWALESGAVTTEKRIEDLLYQMMGDKPAHVMRMLTSLPSPEEKEPGERDLIPGKPIELISPEEDISPEELAERIILHVEHWYNEARNLDSGEEEE